MPHKAKDPEFVELRGFIPRNLMRKFRSFRTDKELDNNQAVEIIVSSYLDKEEEIEKVLKPESENSTWQLNQWSILQTLSTPVLLGIVAKITSILQERFTNESTEALKSVTQPKKTIRQEVQDNLDQLIGQIEYPGFFQVSRLRAIAQGEKPTYEELEPLAFLLQKDLDELESQWRDEYPNGNTADCIENSHR